MSSRSRTQEIDAQRLRESIPYLVHKIHARQLDDTRCFGVYLTPLGVRQLTLLQAEWQRREQELVAPLSPTERQALIASLQTLLGPGTVAAASLKEHARR